ncbi:MAG: DoxX family protein [Pseudomonadota bacterium]
MSYISLLRILRFLATLLSAAAAVLAVLTLLGVSQFGASSQAVSAVTSSSAIYFLIAFLALSSILSVVFPIPLSRLMFLLSLFPLLIGWRIAALSELDLIFTLCTCGFVVFIAIFVTFVAHGLNTTPRSGRPPTTYATVQLAFVRMYIGLDLVPHFTEKLFAGPTVRSGDVQAFQALNVPDPLQFVLLAGVIELSAAIGIGLGLFTRLAAILTVLYLMIATIMGHHFTIGFIWATSGGGWEYPVLWSVLILSFVFGGGRWMSLDEIISEHVRLPRWVEALMGDTASHSHTRMDAATN